MMDTGGFHFGVWYKPRWLKWCGRCKTETVYHTHLNPPRTDREARLQVIYTGVE